MEESAFVKASRYVRLRKANEYATWIEDTTRGLGSVAYSRHDVSVYSVRYERHFATPISGDDLQRIRSSK